MASGFILGGKSRRELEGVHPDLVDMVELAIQFTAIDFTVYDGLRTAAEQRQNVARGASKTMDSFHIRQADGWGHAVDLVPIISGVPKWDWGGCYQVFLAVDRAATQLGIAGRLTWGGVWDRTLAQLTASGAIDVERLVRDYAARHPGKDFLDGPHYQLARG